MKTLLALLLLLAAPAARGADIKLATWNLDWLTTRQAGDPQLPRDVVPKQLNDWLQLRRYAIQLDADIVAFQEVDGPAAAAQVFPPDRFDLYLTDDHVVQRVGFAVRHGLAVDRNPDLVALDVQPTSPHPLRSGADITLVLPGGRLRLLAVHLKTGCHERRLASSNRNCETLRRQIPALQGWIAQRRAEGVPFAILGDFNRVMDGPDELLAALNAAAPLARATEGRDSPCWGGNTFIDHILVGGAARAWMQPDTLKVQVYKETDRSMKDHLSDHCAVSVRLRIP